MFGLKREGVFIKPLVLFSIGKDKSFGEKKKLLQKESANKLQKRIKLLTLWLNWVNIPFLVVTNNFLLLIKT